MQHPGFFKRAASMPLAAVAKQAGAELPDNLASDLAQTLVDDIRTLDSAEQNHVAFLDNVKYIDDASRTRAMACFIKPSLAGRLPHGVIPLSTPTPYHSFAAALTLFYPGALRPQATDDGQTEAISPDALIEDGAVIEPGAVVGPEAAIGAGARICANAIVGYRVHVGRNSTVGPGVKLQNTLIGDHVIIHAGASLGTDGFGFAMGPGGHVKVPQIGRVIVQDHVEIGANTTIDRGALKDTIIGEGTKIDNLVQIGHNAVIGRHCVIVGQVGISGSAVLEDYVVLGGQSGVAGHLTVGTGSMVAGASHVANDLAAGGRYGGTPARTFKQWAREIAALKRLAQQKPKR